MQIKFVKRSAKKLLTKEVLTILERIAEKGLGSHNKITKGTSFKYRRSNFFGVLNKDIIIKFGGKCKSIRKFHLTDKYYPKLAVPTVVVKFGKHNFARIQPKVDTSSKSINMVFKKMDKMSPSQITKMFGNDSHGGNIGTLNGKPVVFDW